MGYKGRYFPEGRMDIKRWWNERDRWVRRLSLACAAVLALPPPHADMHSTRSLSGCASRDHLHSSAVPWLLRCYPNAALTASTDVCARARAARIASRSIVGSVYFSKECEGPPGVVHGGAIATAIDDVLGSQVWRYAGYARRGMPTISLTVRCAC
jgi:hypothetical protein